MTKETYLRHKEYMEQRRLIAEARKAALADKAAKAAANVSHIVRSQYSVAALRRMAEMQ
jgi:hypothetical protein